MIICTLLLWIINLLFRKKKIKSDWTFLKSMEPTQKKKIRFKIFIAAVVMMINWLAFLYVINHIDVQTAALSYMICPIIATLMGFFILKEQLSKEKWIAIFMSIAACSILAYGHFRELYFSLLVATSFAYYLILQRGLNMLDSFNLLTVQATIITLLLLPYYLFNGQPVIQDSQFYYYINIIVVLFTIIPMFLTSYALKGINASTSGILLYLNPIMNFLLAIFYYHEHVSTGQVLAYSIVSISVLVYNSGLIFRKRKKAKATI